ncbi:metal ABC transporter substrate-binding protein [Alkalilimnicola ehrlichii MLHE-1]|uniref:Periplasmic solute binding protein n=1 Tax=Alkalilimnicola ehrlichii (strain ATCC BAA-1101 / DSM 17681 / MLHE-1) TaxID=187272 RepID=Q0AA12_ALKEH|nr:metal ABC transporter substrate-binding protein [Alkalilimnicola ehrlichii]ABI56325.1 periplasmic solute binding protein [Alkalilimnicola ehrlichii MLHE-1]
MHRWILAIALLLFAGLAQAGMNVVATTSNMGMLARTVGGEHVNVTVLAPPDRDAHYLSVRPNMMTHLRRADLVVAVGAELEIGWLPPAIDGAANPAIRPGRSGYFEAAAQVERIGTGVAADRAQGDVHPEGNPHIYLDPVRLATVAGVLAERMGELDEANAQSYQANARRFAEAVEARLPEWEATVAQSPGVLLYHEDADYLLERLGVERLGYVEPLPGVEPTASHLRDLVRRLEGTEGVILRAEFQPGRGPDFMAEQLGWPSQGLPTGVPVNGDLDDYLALIDRWVEAMVP